MAAAGLSPRALSREHLRRVGYHLRMHRGVAMFARVWLLVEGESEFWILPQVAQVMGYDLALEGICCVGFAQCGLDPLVRTAREFGIEWHVLADGDEAGRRYADAARAFIRDARGARAHHASCPSTTSSTASGTAGTRHDHGSGWPVTGTASSASGPRRRSRRRCNAGRSRSSP